MYSFIYFILVAGEVVALPHHAGVPTSVVYLRLLNSHTQKIILSVVQIKGILYFLANSFLAQAVSSYVVF